MCHRVCLLLCLFCLLGIHPQARAVLGERLAPATGASMKQAVRTNPLTNIPYSVHETRQENGVLIKEYADASGKVFAVTWVGPVLPDLEALLGRHFSTLHAHIKATRPTGRSASPLVLAHDTLVLRSTGRMRRFHGHAFAPLLIPQGLAFHDVIQ